MKTTKKDFTKFTKRNTHKRKSKDAAKRELLRAVLETEVGMSGAKIRTREDLGMSAKRRTPNVGREERVECGIFSGSKSGYGFVTLESGYERDIFIPEEKTLGAIDGDYVEVRFHLFRGYSGEEKTEGRVTRVVKYGREAVVGTLIYEPLYRKRKGVPRGAMRAYIIPDDPKLSIKVWLDDTMGLPEGEKVMAKILRDRDAYPYPKGVITAAFGDAEDFGANYGAVLAEAGIPTEFTDEELKCAEESAAEEFDISDRLDLRSKVIFTIDGEGAKDLDDAVSLVKTKTGWQLGVHIADVSHYVKEKTPLDRLVMSRGTSVYFTDKVVPMLPEVLSNGACSLNAGTDKLTLSAIISLDKSGDIVSVRIEPSVIRSRVRGVYSEVNSLLLGEATPEIRAKYREVLPTLAKMKELYELLAARSAARGYIDMDIDEGVIILDANGNPTGVERRERGTAERMIEHFMLTANEAAATLLKERDIPAVYRIHEKPSPDKLDAFSDYVKHLGIDVQLPGYEEITSLDFSHVLGLSEEKGVREAVSRTMLRSMMKAKYSEIRMPHFGLGIENYCHFTSPIRRLSDLAAHRMIHRVLIEGRDPSRYRSYAKRAARAATDTELRAVTAERRIENLYKVLYMREHIGEVFDALVSSVTSFGIFAELDNTCEGLIPISELPGLFTFYENDLSMRCAELIYRIGDRIRVRLVEADMIRGKLRFELVL